MNLFRLATIAWHQFQRISHNSSNGTARSRCMIMYQPHQHGITILHSLFDQMIAKEPSWSWSQQKDNLQQELDPHRQAHDQKNELRQIILSKGIRLQNITKSCTCVNMMGSKKSFSSKFIGMIQSQENNYWSIPWFWRYLFDWPSGKILMNFQFACNHHTN